MKRTLSPALAAAFEAIGGAVGPMPSEDDQLTAAKLRGLMVGYDAVRQQHGYTVHGCEETFIVPVVNLETGHSSRTFRSAGKIDLEISDAQQRIWITDHKTTSEDIEAPDCTYRQQLAIEGQASHYLLAKHLQGVQVYGAIWDVVRKPLIRPKKLTLADAKGVASLGTYCGQSVSDASKAAVIRDGKEAKETPELYQYRLEEEVLGNPAKYYQWWSVPRLESEMSVYADELWQIGQEVVAAKRTDRWYRNSGACMDWGRACQYLGICSGYDTPDSANWQRRPCVHEELELDGDGRDLLTNSAIKCFLTCRRKFYLHYALGIERVDRQEEEALRFGHLFHLACEAWWKSFIPNHGGTDGNHVEIAAAGNTDTGSV